MSISPINLNRRDWFRAIFAGGVVAAFGGAQAVNMHSVSKERHLQSLFNKPMEIKTLWGSWALLSEYGSNEGSMQKLIDKYGFHHIKTKYVRDTEITARIIESNIIPKIRKHFPDFNDGYLLNALARIVRKEIKPYEMDCTHLSEGCAQELTQSITNTDPNKLYKEIASELEELNNPFGLKLTRR